MFRNLFKKTINNTNNGGIYMSGSSVTINGKVINVENGKSISIIGNTIFVDGQEIDTKETDLGVHKNQTVNIIVHGDVGTIDCSGSVTVCR